MIEWNCGETALAAARHIWALFVWKKGANYVDQTQRQTGSCFTNRREPEKRRTLRIPLAMHIQKVVKRLWEKYNEENIIPLPRITPHVFRHTFCTNMANAGMDLKSLQYLMGHSDVSVTLNVYTHNSYEKAEESMAKIVSFGGELTTEKTRRLG